MMAKNEEPEIRSRVFFKENFEEKEPVIRSRRIAKDRERIIKQTRKETADELYNRLEPELCDCRWIFRGETHQDLCKFKLFKERTQEEV